jgi:hypothetical protein
VPMLPRLLNNITEFGISPMPGAYHRVPCRSIGFERSKRKRLWSNSEATHMNV